MYWDLQVNLGLVIIVTVVVSLLLVAVCGVCGVWAYKKRPAPIKPALFDDEVNLIGKGSCGAVYECKFDGHPFAVKLFSKPEDAEVEMRIQQALPSHPNIVR